MHITRREVLAGGAALGGTLVLPAAQARASAAPAALPVASAAQVQQLMTAFARGAAPMGEGLLLEVPTLADNPSAVAVRVAVTQPITEQRWCESVILVAERNPQPLACSLHFQPLAGTAEAAVRLRLAQSQTVHALARMSDGQVLHAKKDITVAASGCGM